jgi:hypothetical protein
MDVARTEQRPRFFAVSAAPRTRANVRSVDMGSSYERALEGLFRAPLASFVAERKRLAAELKLEGDTAGAARLAKMARPTLSAWVVNQLWWTEREMFERLLRSAAALRVGDADALAAHRTVLAELRERASELLSVDGKSPNESMLRRVSTTLAALAASGGFEPDLPGTLSADRDPPGFDAAFSMLETQGDASPKERASVSKAADSEDAAKHAEAERDLQSKRAEAERKRLEAEKKRLDAERTRLSAAVDRQEREVTAREGDVARLRDELASAERRLEEARTRLTSIAKELAGLDDSETT